MYVPLILNVTMQLRLPVAATNPTHTAKKPQRDDSRHRPLTQRLIWPADGESQVDNAPRELHSFVATSAMHPKLSTAGTANGFDEARSAA